MVPIVKSALVDSLHAVFWFGLMFVLLGALLTPMLGKIKLVKQPRKKTRQGGFKRCCNRVTDKGYEKLPQSLNKQCLREFYLCAGGGFTC